GSRYSRTDPGQDRPAKRAKRDAKGWSDYKSSGVVEGRRRRWSAPVGISKRAATSDM
ncbi:hypothetical protein AVEN_153243-1, partial [Araneus ventricosus]